jgi:hypothetical protein
VPTKDLGRRRIVSAQGIPDRSLDLRGGLGAQAACRHKGGGCREQSHVFRFAPPREPINLVDPSRLRRRCCLDDDDIVRDWNGFADTKTGACQQLTMLPNSPLLAARHREHHNINGLAKCWRVLAAEAVFDQQQYTIVWNRAAAIEQAPTGALVIPVAEAHAVLAFSLFMYEWAWGATVIQE